mgnify:CR=1 FL=1
MIGLIVILGIGYLARIALSGRSFWAQWPLVSVLAAIASAILTIGSPSADLMQHAGGGLVGVGLFGMPVYIVCLLVARSRRVNG